MGIYGELQRISTNSPAPKPAPKHMGKKQESVKKERSVNQPMDPLANRSTDRSIGQSIDQSTNPPADHLTNVDELGPVVEKPRAFYITQKVDRWLDDAVRYLQGKGLYKVDRSILINALIHDPDIFKTAALDKLRGRLLAHLTNKSLRRV